MLCPFCKEKDTSVVDSRPTEDGTAIRRRRVCLCGGGQRFTTFERVQFRELTVIKKSGRRTPFERDKLAKSLFTALKQRPIDGASIEKLVTKISSSLEIFVTSFSMLAPSMGLCFNAVNKDFANLSLSKGVLLPLFLTTVNSLN
jgi:transcriptional regulator NrdR